MISAEAGTGPLRRLRALLLTAPLCLVTVSMAIAYNLPAPAAAGIERYGNRLTFTQRFHFAHELVSGHAVSIGRLRPICKGYAGSKFGRRAYS